MEVKERIIRQAGELFLQHGVRSVSMDEIAAKLGMSKRTIYTHFADKEELLMLFIKSIADKQVERIKELQKTLPTVIEVFLHVIETHKPIMNSNVRFIEDIEKYYPSAHQWILEKREINARHAKEFLEEGVNQGVIRSNLNLDLISFLLLNTNNTLMSVLQMLQLPFSTWELFFTMMINFIRGISTEKGIKIVDAYLENISTDKEYTN